MSAFAFEIANVYNNLTNIVLRIAPKGSSAKAVLVNSHYDSTLGTPGEPRPLHFFTLLCII